MGFDFYLGQVKNAIYMSRPVDMAVEDNMTHCSEAASFTLVSHNRLLE